MEDGEELIGIAATCSAVKMDAEGMVAISTSCDILRVQPGTLKQG